MSDEEYKKIFAQKINYYLVQNRKNQSDLIRDLGLSSSTVSNWCTGLKLPRMGTIQMIADYFGIEKSDLLEDKKEDYYLNKETAKIAQEMHDNSQLKLLFSAARDASPEDLEATYNILMALKKKEKKDGTD